MSQASWKKWLVRIVGLGTAVLGAASMGPRFAALRTARAGEEAAVTSNYTRNVAIVLYEGVELLDFAGPGEVFAAAARQGTDRGQLAFKVYTVAPTRTTIKSQRFLDVTPDYALEDAPAPDILVIPGGASQTLTDDRRFMSWAGEAMKNAKVTLTVCTGAFVPARAGLLDGLAATTHHGSFDSLRSAAPRASIIEGKRFVDNGSIVTTGGVSAGIDGALHVVARLLGRRVADNTASYMEYHWTPEAYLALSYSYFNPSLDAHGRELEQAIVYEDSKDWDSAEKAYRRVVAAHPRDGFGHYGLAAVLQAKGQWDGAIEAGERAAKFAAVRSDALFCVACAYARKGDKEEALRKLGMAVAAGFKSKWNLEHEPDLASLRGDARYEQLVKAL